MFYDRVSVHASVGVDPTSDEDEPKDSLHVRLVAIAVCSTVTSQVCDVIQYRVDCSHVALSCMCYHCCTCHLELY